MKLRLIDILPPSKVCTVRIKGKDRNTESIVLSGTVLEGDKIDINKVIVKSYKVPFSTSDALFVEVTEE